jgi:hypothetical protein
MSKHIKDNKHKYTTLYLKQQTINKSELEKNILPKVTYIYDIIQMNFIFYYFKNTN